MGSNVKSNSNYSIEDQPTNIGVHSSCKDENATKVVLRTLTLKSLISQKVFLRLIIIKVSFVYLPTLMHYA